MIKRIIVFAKENKKTFIALMVLVLMLSGDAALFIIDQFIGSQKYIVFNWELTDLIIFSNLLVVGIFTFIILSYIMIRHSKHTILNITITVFYILIFIVFVEFIFHFVRKYSYKPSPYAYELAKKDLFIGDSLLGYKFSNNIVRRFAKVLVDPTKENKPGDTTFVFNTIVTTDSIGNRLIDIPGIINRKKYAIFFGCSYTSGTGVMDTQTVPYYFAEFDSGFCSYNFGCPGYSPSQMLSQLRYNNVKDHIRQDSGVGFYIYMWAHPSRVIGDMRTFINFGENFPYYKQKKDNLDCLGSFKQERKFISAFYRLMNKSDFINYFNINFPSKIKNKHYKLTCNIIYESYLEYKKQFHNENFYVVLYPGNQDILNYLNKYDIKILDFSNLFDAYDEKYCISVYDRHPTALAHKIVTKHLIDVINNLDSN